MPTISLFYGIRITINSNKHNPPHFHAAYGDYQASFDIQECSLLKGFMPRRQLHCILAWCAIHSDELMQNWELVRDGQEPNRISPLQ